MPRKQKASSKGHSSCRNGRFTTGYACKSWHGSLNPSDSYVPLVMSYPGGNKTELKKTSDAVCVNNACKDNWILPSLIKDIIKKQSGN